MEATLVLSPPILKTANMSAQLQTIEDNLRDLLEDFFSAASTVVSNPDETTTADPITGEVVDSEDAVLTYTLADLQTEIYKITSMRSRFIKNDSGMPQVKELAFSPDEQLLFDSLAKDAANDVFKILCGLTKNINNAFLYDETAEVDDWVIGTDYVVRDFVKYTDNKIYKCIHATDTIVPTDPTGDEYWEDYSWLDATDKILFVVELPQYFNANYLNVLDNNVWTALKKYILKEWWRNTGLLQDYQIELNEWESARTEVKYSFVNRTKSNARKPNFY
jgi:hypothetical protein